jgi:hypothetical protein
MTVDDDMELAEAQVGHEIGEAAGRCSEVDRSRERSIEEGTPETGAAQTRAAGTEPRGQAVGAEAADVVGVEQLAAGDGDGCTGHVGVRGAGSQFDRGSRVAIAADGSAKADSDMGIEAEVGA